MIKKIILKKNYKCRFVFFFLLIYITITPTEILNELINKVVFNKILFNSNEIFYRGKRISKEKLINDYLLKISNDYITEKEDERKNFYKFFNLAYYSSESNIQEKLRAKYLQEISKIKNQKVTELETFFLSSNYNFGNGLITINNAIFFCEVVKCHKIILNQTQVMRRWLIIKPIYITKLNITIMQGSNIDCKNSKIFCINTISQMYYPIVIIPQVRIHFIRDEILKNLPIVNINKNDLYIHIRGGDIFGPNPHQRYSQPPLCFYEKIINNNLFNNIFIVAVDQSNIIVKVLIKKYKNTIHNLNTIEYDISLLSHAYNIVVSVSSFGLSAIKLNTNLKNLWEYDIMRLYVKFLFLHHHISKFDIQYKIYTMKPSNIYMSKMFAWKGTKEQIKLMLEENCPYDFEIFNPKINSFLGFI